MKEPLEVLLDDERRRDEGSEGPEPRALTNAAEAHGANLEDECEEHDGRHEPERGRGMSQVGMARLREQVGPLVPAGLRESVGELVRELRPRDGKHETRERDQHPGHETMVSADGERGLQTARSGGSPLQALSL